MFYTTGEMLPFQERKKFRKILYSKATLVVLFFLVVVIGRGAWQIHQKAVIAQGERAQAARAVEELNLRVQGLEKSLTRLRSPEGAEGEARQKYTVARPSEEVVIIVDVDAKKGKNGEGVEERSLWGRFMSLFDGE